MPTELCACGQIVEAQHLRHLTRAEYDALPEGLRAIDGYAVTPVFTCGDCAPAPICEHPRPPGPAPCPTCDVPPEAPCVKADGSPRLHPHRSRTETRGAEPCLHAHREDCDHRACRCTGDDPPPVRPPRIVGADAPQAPPDGMLLDAAAWMAAHGIDPALVRGGFRSGFTQDNRPAMLFDYVTAPDDGHGHEVVELRAVPVDVPTP